MIPSVADHLCTSVISVYQSCPSPFAVSYILLTVMSWLYHLLVLCAMVHIVSVSRHLRFGTCCRLILRTETLSRNSSNRALRLGCLCRLTHRRHFWQLLYKHCFTDVKFVIDGWMDRWMDWLIDWLILLSIADMSGYRSSSPTAVRPSNPALCGSCPLVTPYYYRLGDLLCYPCMLYLSTILCVYAYLYFVFSLFSGLFSFVDFPSVLWYCLLGLLTCKNRLPYNLYYVGGDVKTLLNPV